MLIKYHVLLRFQFDWTWSLHLQWILAGIDSFLTEMENYLFWNYVSIKSATINWKTKIWHQTSFSYDFLYKKDFKRKDVEFMLKELIMYHDLTFVFFEFLWKILTLMKSG